MMLMYPWRSRQARFGLMFGRFRIQDEIRRTLETIDG
jgi:hypothetical protein